jgi:hypothetical protein
MPCNDMVPDPLFHGIFTRKYTGALVVVNASINQTFVLTLPHLEYTSIFGEKVLSPLTIAPDTGAVLLTTQGCH